LLAGAAVICALAALAFTVLWIQERGRADDLSEEVAAFEADAEAREAEEDARQAEEDARPDLIQIARDLDEDDFGVDYTGDEDSLSVQVEYNLEWVEAYLEATGFPSATIDRMGQTRALDGTLEAQGDDVSATWTYHPDDGLSIVFSVDE